MKTHPQISGNSVGTPLRLGWLLLIPLLVTSLPAQTNGPELTIQQSTNDTCLLTWQVTTNDYVVFSAPDMYGPWKPCLNHMTKAAGTCSMSVPAPDPTEYFRLVEGYYEDFEDGDLEGWTVATVEPDASTYLTWEATNGQLRVYGTWPGTNLQRHVVFYRTNLMMTNLTMSVHILELGGDQVANVVLMGRLRPRPLDFPDVYSYGGGVGMQHSQYTNQSALWLQETWPGGWGANIEPISKLDSAKDYRLDFSLVGDLATVNLWELTNGTSWLASVQGTDSTLTVGWVGFYVAVYGPDGNVDFTLDDFLVYAKP